MAELGSHQLDAASIFISALRNDGKKAHPLSVHAVGGRHIFPVDRDAHDHVYCTFEFPGPGYEAKDDPMAYGYQDKRTGVDARQGIAPYETRKYPSAQYRRRAQSVPCSPNGSWGSALPNE